jgi:hypothetical protein
MNYIICAIAKLENDYLYEWAKYHLDLGFSCIHVYDNNDADGERVSDVFRGSDCENNVIIHDVRGQHYMQKKVYQECYDYEYFDWCAFIDIDEFITFEEKSEVRTITDFLKDKNEWEAVHLNWMCYGDCGMVRNNHKPVLERFRYPKKPFGFYYNYTNHSENEHIKSIIRKGLKIDWCRDDDNYESNPHTPYGLDLICDSTGRKTNNSPFSPICYKVAYIRHYTTKTVEEYATKVVRQCADCDNIGFYGFSKFFRMNRPSLKKLLWLKGNHPNTNVKDCMAEYIKSLLLNYDLPFKSLFRSLKKVQK